jgi:hypothetical protein
MQGPIHGGMDADIDSLVTSTDKMHFVVVDSRQDETRLYPLGASAEPWQTLSPVTEGVKESF